MLSLSSNAVERTPVPPAISHGGSAGALKVLVVEDDDAVRTVCAELAASAGCHVRTADSVPAARACLGTSATDLVFLDMRLPGGSGASLLEEIRSAHPGAFVVVMTAYATVNSAVEMMRNGAGDFLPKPFALDQISAVLERAAERRQWSDLSRTLQDRLEAGIGAGRLIGQSVAMQKLFRIVSKVASTRHPVLLCGERGTGKEVVARAIHANGPQAMQPFVPVDCDALQPDKLEQELFGRDHNSAHDGVLATTGEGTVYLAEVGALDAALQAKLLRALQDRQVRSPDGRRSVPLRARVLAASSWNLESLVDTGKFRKDLFYRLNVVNLRVPPLRDRLEDLPLLAERFLERHRRERGIPFTLTEGAMTALLGYQWSGNVQELDSLITRACAIASGPLLHFDDMSTEIKAFTTATMEPEARPAPTEGIVSFKTLQELEREAIESTLHLLGGDKVLAAKSLGIGKTTLYRKLKEYGIGLDAA